MSKIYKNKIRKSQDRKMVSKKSLRRVHHSNIQSCHQYKNFEVKFRDISLSRLFIILYNTTLMKTKTKREMIVLTDLLIYEKFTASISVPSGRNNF